MICRLPVREERLAISVPPANKVSDIPMDYDGVMGVPITILDKFNPSQFEIVGISGTLARSFRDKNGKLCSGRFYVKGKRLYDRIVIKRKE